MKKIKIILIMILMISCARVDVEDKMCTDLEVDVFFVTCSDGSGLRYIAEERLDIIAEEKLCMDEY